jgi:hypothetical protein
MYEKHGILMISQKILLSNAGYLIIYIIRKVRKTERPKVGKQKNNYFPFGFSDFLTLNHYEL